MTVKNELKPKARKQGLIVQELQDETLVYDQDCHRAHCLNKTASLVWKSCNGTKSVGEIGRGLSAQLNVQVSREIVALAIDELSKRHLMDVPRGSEARTGPTRREVLRRIGLGAAVAIPIITSLVAPHAAQAGSCLPSGASCSTSAQCCSGLCNGTTCV